MKVLFAAVVVLSVAGCATEAPQPDNSVKMSSRSDIVIYKNEEEGVDSIISNEALESFKSEYSSARENKAFAQSTSGAWSWKSNRTSVAHARTSALIGCQRNNQKLESLYPCEIINVNGEWVK